MLKKNLIILCILTIMLYSCGGSELRSQYVCNCDEQKELQNFVKESIKNANNMSDEEMEDVIYQLRLDGTKIYCKQLPVWLDHNGNVDWKKQYTDSCFIIMQDY